MSFEHYAMLLAWAAAHRSEDPHRQVGASCFSITDRRTIGTASNGLCSGKEVPDAFWKDRDARRIYCVHAEQNLTSLFNRGEVGVVAVTTCPCHSCATLLSTYGVKKVLYGVPYDRDHDEESAKVFKFYGVELVHVPLEETLKAAGVEIVHHGLSPGQIRPPQLLPKS